MKKKIKLSLLVGFCLFGLIGCGETNEMSVAIKGEEVSRIDTDKLASFSGSLVGDNSAMVGIINALPGNIYFDKVILQTEKEPFGINVMYSKNKINEEQIKNFLKESKGIMFKNAREMFILVENLGEITFDLTNLGGDKFNFKRSDFISEGCDGLKVFEVKPYKGVGNFEIGMTREEVEKVADDYRGKGITEIESPKVFEKEMYGPLVQSFEAIHFYYDKENKVEFIEFTGDIALNLDGKLFKNNYEENLKAIKELDKEVFIEEGGFTSEKYGISSQNIDNAPVSIFKKDYYKDITKCGNA